MEIRDKRWVMNNLCVELEKIRKTNGIELSFFYEMVEEISKEIIDGYKKN